MRRIGALLIALAYVAPAMTAEPPAEPTEAPSIPWYRWVFLGERPKPMPAKPVVANKAPAVPAKNAKEEATRTLEHEQKIYLQRLAAVSRIRQIATDRGDDEMLKKADELEKQADEVFRQRTALLPGGNDRARLERDRDEGAPTADATRRRPTRGGDR